jgi:hypothetical protein
LLTILDTESVWLCILKGTDARMKKGHMAAKLLQ